MSRSAAARSTALFAGVALTGCAAVAAALVSQHIYDMQPCAWCVLQRLLFVAIALAALLGLVWRTRAGARLAGALVALLAVGGVASALWQHFVAAASFSCDLTLAQKIISAVHADVLLPEVFEARAMCADAKVDLVGLPYEFWSLGLFVLLGLAAVLAAGRAGAARRYGRH